MLSTRIFQQRNMQWYTTAHTHQPIRLPHHHESKALLGGMWIQENGCCKNPSRLQETRITFKEIQVGQPLCLLKSFATPADDSTLLNPLGNSSKFLAKPDEEASDCLQIDFPIQGNLFAVSCVLSRQMVTKWEIIYASFFTAHIKAKLTDNSLFILPKVSQYKTYKTCSGVTFLCQMNGILCTGRNVLRMSYKILQQF